MVDRKRSRRLRRRDYRRQLDPALSRSADSADRFAAGAAADPRESRRDPHRGRSFLAAVHQPLAERRRSRRRVMSASAASTSTTPSRYGRYEIGDHRIEARIWMEPGAHTTYAAWLWRPGADVPANGLSLRLTLLANDRDHHGTTSVGSFAPDIRVDGESLLLNDAGLFSLTVRAPGGTIAAKHDWYRDFDLPMEAERGLNSTDSHLCIGEVTIPLIPGEWRGMVAGLEPEPSADLDGCAAPPARSRPCGRSHRGGQRSGHAGCAGLDRPACARGRHLRVLTAAPERARRSVGHRRLSVVR